MVHGDSGSGKTRLGEEVAARARLEGAAVTHIRCVQSDRDVPWSGLAGLCRGGLLDPQGPIIVESRDALSRRYVVRTVFISGFGNKIEDLPLALSVVP